MTRKFSILKLGLWADGLGVGEDTSDHVKRVGREGNLGEGFDISEMGWWTDESPHIPSS